MSSINPIQKVEQEILNAAVTEDEQLTMASPLPIQTPTIEEKQKLAYEIWEAAGAVQNSPLTLNFWLQAEVEIESESPLKGPVE